MAVVRLRTRRDAKEQTGLEALRDVLQDMAAAGAPSGVVDRLVAVVERELASRRGWGFVMVEPNLNAEVVAHLAKHSRRKLTAVQLWARLFEVLPPDSNEVLVSRAELARLVGCEPRTVSEIMGELEEIGAVYRQKEGRGVRYFVHPRLGTHLTGAVRDRAQAEAPPLKLRLVDPAG
jgi:DNA-binding transcriptional ArsR family regulator